MVEWISSEIYSFLLNKIKQMKGRGACSNPNNPFLKNQISKTELDGIDDWEEADLATEYIKVFPKTIVNRVDSPDIPFDWNMNPYQGCEHGCIYCYARNTFEYWGYSAGLDFEQKILIKENAASLLKKFLQAPSWKAEVISLSGNTDCYQPAEKKFKLTQELLKVCNQFNQPVSIITKNAGILRDLPLLQEMAAKHIVSVMMTVTTLDESLRLKMEPRTATGYKRIQAIEKLAKHGIPVGVMIAPIIPGLNDHEVPQILHSAHSAGASRARHTIIRLEGSVKILFEEWVHKNFPDKAEKVIHAIQQNEGKKMRTRMKGDGLMASMIEQVIAVHTRKLGMEGNQWNLNKDLFRRDSQLSLF